MGFVNKRFGEKSVRAEEAMQNIVFQKKITVDFSIGNACSSKDDAEHIHNAAFCKTRHCVYVANIKSRAPRCARGSQDCLNEDEDDECVRDQLEYTLSFLRADDVVIEVLSHEHHKRDIA